MMHQTSYSVMQYNIILEPDSFDHFLFDALFDKYKAEFFLTSFCFTCFQCFTIGLCKEFKIFLLHVILKKWV